MDRHNHVVSIAPTERLGKSADALPVAGDTVGDRREFGSGAFEGVGHTSRLQSGHTVPGTVGPLDRTAKSMPKAGRSRRYNALA